MSCISCPLCGKNSSLNYFDPQSLDKTIYVHDVKGLGRAKGFKVVNKRNAFIDSPEVNKIKLRLLDLVLMLYKNDILSEEELNNKLGLPLADQSEYIEKYNKAISKLKETKNKLEEVEDEHEDAKSEIKDYLGTFGSLVSKIADALDEDSWDWEVDDEEEELDDNEESINTLEFGVERLIDDYLALKASDED